MHRLIDTHIHFDHSRFENDRDDVYKRATNNGISAMIIPAVTRENWAAVESVANNYKNVFATIGLHPMFCRNHQEADLTLLEQNLATKNYVAIGECGLDGYIEEPESTHQKLYFNIQLELAKRYRLPVIIHARSAVEQVILTLKDQALSHATGNGVIHSYNGSLQQAHKLIDLGFKLSFGGAITYSRSLKLHKLVKKLPLDSIMLETDAPDQPPMLFKGQRNEPAYITAVLTAVATLRNQDPVIIARQSNENAKQLFALPLSL